MRRRTLRMSVQLSWRQQVPSVLTIARPKRQPKGGEIEMLTTLLSMTFLLPAVWLAYTVRAYWVARDEWKAFSPDTKAFYLMVAPPLTLAVDLVMLTDRIFYSPD